LKKYFVVGEEKRMKAGRFVAGFCQANGISEKIIAIMPNEFFIAGFDGVFFSTTISAASSSDRTSHTPSQAKSIRKSWNTLQTDDQSSTRQIARGNGRDLWRITVATCQHHQGNELLQ
jgi:hypothetical protein